MTSYVDPSSPLPAAGARRTRPAWRRQPVGLWLAGAFVALLLLAAAWPQLFTPADPLEGDVTRSLLAPGAAQWFGTDRLGRDVFARVVHGAHYSLLIGLAAMGVSVLGGVLLGIASGLGRRVLDEAVSRAFDVISAFPSVLLALLVVTFLGPGMANIALAIGIAGIPKFGRVVRSQALLVRRADYVRHAVIYGRGRLQILWRHVLPNVLVAIPVIATINLGSAIIAVSGLSFLGLGPQPPTPEWGVMLAEGRDILRVAWWAGVFPGLFITLSVIALTVLGNDLQRRFEGRT
ncbi:MAG: ABC transporter permease [Comamonas sp.]